VRGAPEPGGGDGGGWCDRRGRQCAGGGLTFGRRRVCGGRPPRRVWWRSTPVRASVAGASARGRGRGGR